MGGEGKANTQDSRILRLKLMQWSVPIGTHQYPTGLVVFLNAPIPDIRGWCLLFGLLKFFVLIFLIRALSSWKASAIRNEYFSCFWTEIQIKRERALLDRSLDIRYCARHFTYTVSFYYYYYYFGPAASREGGGGSGPSSPTRNQTSTPCSGNTEFQPLEHQGRPLTYNISTRLINWVDATVLRKLMLREAAVLSKERQLLSGWQCWKWTLDICMACGCFTFVLDWLLANTVLSIQ